MLVTLAIVTVLVAMAGIALLYGGGRARLRNTMADLSALVPIAQMRAQSTGRPHYLVLTDTFVSLIDRADPLPPATSDALDYWSNVDLSALRHPGNLPNQAGVLVELRELDLANVIYAPLAAVPFPAPYSSVPNAGTGAATPLTQACSICVTQASGARGVLRFNPDGTMTVRTGNRPDGLAVRLTVNRAEEKGPGAQTRTLVVAAPGGVARVFNN